MCHSSPATRCLSCKVFEIKHEIQTPELMNAIELFSTVHDDFTQILNTIKFVQMFHIPFFYRIAAIDPIYLSTWSFIEYCKTPASPSLLVVDGHSGYRLFHEQ
jgi:hypothetical protein